MGISRFAAHSVAVLIMTIGLAGCTSAPAQIAEATPTPTVSTSASAAASSTVAQWASFMAQQQADWQEWTDGWDESDCGPTLASMKSGIICRVQLTSAMFMSETTTIEHQLAVTPGRKGFIARTPPAEITALFEQTKAAAQAVKAAADAWDAAGCPTELSDNCAGLTYTFDSAISDLGKTYVGWSPYL